LSAGSPPRPDAGPRRTWKGRQCGCGLGARSCSLQAAQIGSVHSDEVGEGLPLKNLSGATSKADDPTLPQFVRFLPLSPGLTDPHPHARCAVSGGTSAEVARGGAAHFRSINPRSAPRPTSPIQHAGTFHSNLRGTRRESRPARSTSNASARSLADLRRFFPQIFLAFFFLFLFFSALSRSVAPQVASRNSGTPTRRSPIDGRALTARSAQNAPSSSLPTALYHGVHIFDMSDNGGQAQARRHSSLLLSEGSVLKASDWRIPALWRSLCAGARRLASTTFEGAGTMADGLLAL